jgi:predicted RNase H-like nuclease (RuvC/YqgF family)
MDDAFDRLEERVRAAAELVQRLRADKKLLEQQADEARARLEAAEKKLVALEKEHGGAAERARKLDGLEREVDSLRHERDEVRTRVARLVDLLDSLE